MTEPTRLAAPPALRPGDAIGVVAPASSPRPDAFEAARARLEALGHRVKTYRDFTTPHGYLAGTDAERVAELEQAFRDPETAMVLAVRGGYGCGRIVDRVDFGPLVERPKIVYGYSDLTALHAAVNRRAGLFAFHGPNLVGGLGGDPGECSAEIEATLSLLRGEPPGLLLEGSDPLTIGTATGRLIGGNLAVFSGLLGTPDEPSFDGAILAIEDTGEAPYRVDRLLTQLRVGGRLRRLAGVVLGYFSESDPDGCPPVEQVLTEFLTPLGVPVLAGAPFGHEHPNLPLPLGARVRLDADAARLELLEEVVRG